MPDWVNWHWKWKLVCPLLLFISCVMGALRKRKHVAEELSPVVMLVTTEKTDEWLHVGYILYWSSKYTRHYETSNNLPEVKNGNIHLLHLKNKYFLITWKVFCHFQSADKKNQKNVLCRYFYLKLKIKIKASQQKLALLICFFFHTFFSSIHLNVFWWSCKFWVFSS